jgi:hypothetical protein
MSETEGPREDAPNPTQEAIDQEGPSDELVDVGGWEETESSPHAGEAGQSGDVA